MIGNVPLVAVRDLTANYGPSRALHGVTFDVNEGEVVTLIGRNGAGKTTTLRAIFGLLRHRTGSISVRGVEAIHLPPEKIAHLGLAYCPEERGIFASLTVEENLELPPTLRPGGMTTAEIYAAFPRLQERRKSQGNKLSGGEQQILAIARILRSGANCLLLDEPTEGLAPVIVKQIMAMIRDLKKRGYTILLVEQNFTFAAKLADKHYVMEHGRIVDQFTSAEALQNKAKIQSYLSV